jgi:hypothetical protein
MKRFHPCTANTCTVRPFCNENPYNGFFPITNKHREVVRSPKSLVCKKLITEYLDTKII